jgi:2'-5' RNA ligase
MTCIAIDIAILPPPDMTARAIALSASLPAHESQGLLLGRDYLPHATLTQQFVRVDALDQVIAHVDRVLRDRTPLPLHVTGGGKGSNSVWIAIERTQPLVRLHEDLMGATESFERSDGDETAFFGPDARDRDVSWVRGFRRESSFDRFTPHITIGHSAQPPDVEPMEFIATTIAVCHLGRFCTCRRIIREWALNSAF